MKKRYIVLENNEVFEGVAFGADKDSVGELVFATGMCGYIETLTDPSYYGQIGYADVSAYRKLRHNRSRF